MNTKTIVTFVVVTLGILVGVGMLLTRFGTSSAEQVIADIAGDKTHVLGAGQVTIVEFSDFQCPACLSVEAPLKELLGKYTGKVQLVYRYFPLSAIHKNAQISAQAGEAAGRQDKFWEMHDKLFATQLEWEGMSDPKATFLSYARELEMDEAKFMADIDSQDVKQAVNVDVLAANKYKLPGTPTFFVNGVQTDFGQIEGKIQDLTK